MMRDRDNQNYVGFYRINEAEWKAMHSQSFEAAARSRHDLVARKRFEFALKISRIPTLRLGDPQLFNLILAGRV